MYAALPIYRVSPRPDKHDSMYKTCALEDNGRNCLIKIIKNSNNINEFSVSLQDIAISIVIAVSGFDHVGRVT